MQLTLDDLRKANDPLAALLGADDEDLDRVAAEVQGWELHRGRYNVWFDGNKPLISTLDYRPSRNLNQGYVLMDLGCKEHLESRVVGRPGFRRVSYYPQRNAPNRTWDDYATLINTAVLEVQAGSHARAVVVLAILGLLQGKDGAA